VITAISQDDTATYFVREHAGLEEGARRHGISVHWSGPSDSNGVEQQIAIADRAIRAGDSGLVITPLSPAALIPVIKRALRQAMPVVVLGTPMAMPHDPSLTFVLNDSEQSGRLAAKRTEHRLGSTGEVAVIGLDPALPTTALCAAAFEATLRQLAPGIRVVARLPAGISTGQAELMLADVMVQHPRLRAIYSLDIWATRSAFAAVRDAGREGSIVIVGNDEAMDLLYLLHHGVIDSLVVEDMRGMGAQAIENIAALRSGRSAPVTTVLEPTLLTADNIDTEPMQQRLRMDWRHPVAEPTR
jgi:ABC-type sugar transport system substrate-binding protein